MKKILSAIIFCLCITAANAQTVYRYQVDGEVYVKFTKAALKEVSKDNPNNIPVSKLASVNKILTKYGVTRAYKPFYQADDDEKLPYILKFEFSQITKVDAFINELKTAPGVEYAEKVNLNKVDITPNDPTFGTHLNQINATNAWNVYNSTTFGNSNITVAICDNAVDRAHNDLVGNIYTNAGEIANNSIDDDGNGYIDDVNGWDAADNDNNTIPTQVAMNHGTHCAGIAGASTNNGLGVASIGWNIKIVPVKCQNDAGTTTSIPYGYQGIIYAAKIKARVISCSWGGAGTASAAEQSVIDYAWNRGCIVICAAGNDGGTANETVLHYPAAYNNVYCVASVATSNVKSSFSCRGTWVDIAAPGENIMSTTPSNGYMSFSGTSMATPLVAGLAGLMLSKCSFMTQNDVLNCISTNAVNIYTISGNSAYASGNQLGAGRIEAFASMNCAASFLTLPPIANFFTLTRNICPGVSVAFIDSSMYAPTSYTWTFQGGTPATSNAANPSVQWASPGTYSVSLKAANANGNNTKVKLAYITVAGPIALPLIEGFQATTFLPPNWTPYNVNNDANYFTRVTGPTLGGFGTSTACVTYDNYDIDAAPDRDEMRTPKYTFSNVASARLRFDVAYKEYDNTAGNLFSDSLEVKLSTNCGTSWTNIYLKGGSTLSSSAGTLQANMFTPTAAQWRRDTIDVSALTAGQGNVMFSFVNHGHYGQALYLDNINLVFPTPTLNFSLPTSTCVGATFNLTNTSIGASNTTYTWTMTGGSPATSNAVSPSVSYAAAGVYTITLVGANGTSTASVTHTINISSPVVSVNNQTICPGGTATITASGATSYSWSTGFTGNPLLVSPSSNTTYTVIGTTTGCTNTKTVSVSVGSSLSVLIATNPASICVGGTATLTGSGATAYTWTPGSSNATSITASPSINTTYTLIGSNGSCTGSATAVVNVIAPPAINVATTPATTICAGKSVTMTASSTYTSYAYSWVTTTVTGAVYSVTPATSASYTVSASGAGGCTTSSIIAITVNSNPLTVPSKTNANCVNPCSGMVNASTSAGTPPFTYSLSSGCSSMPCTSLCAGNYTLTTTDAAGCKSTNTFSIFAPSNNIIANITSTNATCGSCADGSANVFVGNGTSPYTYSWSPVGGNNPTANSLTPGCYTVIVTDANGCVVSPSICVGFATGIQSTAGNNTILLIYPNPAQSNVTVQYTGASFNYTLYNNLGQLIAADKNVQNSTTINLNTIARGVYLIEVEIGKEKVRKKLILE